MSDAHHHPRLLSTRPRRAAAVLAVVVVAAAAGCGSGTPAASHLGAITTTSVTTTVPAFNGHVADLPRPSGSRRVGSGSLQGRVATQSYEVDDLTPKGVLDYFTRALRQRGWDQGDAAHRIGATAFEGTWVHDQYHLRVTADHAPGLSGGAAGPVTQFSLELRG